MGQLFCQLFDTFWPPTSGSFEKIKAVFASLLPNLAIPWGGSYLRRHFLTLFDPVPRIPIKWPFLLFSLKNVSFCTFCGKVDVVFVNFWMSSDKELNTNLVPLHCAWTTVYSRAYTCRSPMWTKKWLKNAKSITFLPLQSHLLVLFTNALQFYSGHNSTGVPEKLAKRVKWPSKSWQPKPLFYPFSSNFNT